MRFVDEARIRVKAGDGGTGIVSWRRENLFLWEVLPVAMAAAVVM